jgi:hypothetical protein
MENLPQKRSGYLVATNIGEAKEIAELIGSTDFLPKSYRHKTTLKPKINEIIIAGDMGARHGWNMFQSLQAICVINNRPSIWGDYFWGLILSDPRFVKHKEIWDKDIGGGTWTVEIWKKGSDVPVIGTFSLQEAASAGLLHSKDKAHTWGKYPKDMCLWKARSRAGKSGFADRIQGFEMVEEARDIVDVTYKVVQEENKQIETTRTDKLKADMADKLKAENKGEPKEEAAKQPIPKKTPTKPSSKKKAAGEDKEVIRARVAKLINEQEHLHPQIKIILEPAIKAAGLPINNLDALLDINNLTNELVIHDAWIKTMDKALEKAGYYK